VPTTKGRPIARVRESGSETVLAPPSPSDAPTEDVETLVVQNPQMNAASFLALLKSKGFVITPPKPGLQGVPPLAPEVRARTTPEVTPPVKEAQGSIPALDRAGVKESIKESGAACRFLESSAGVGSNGDPRYVNRFRCILIQEGLGNLRDGFYYTKESLKSAVPVFEGRKYYADHPTPREEEERPERSVRDVYGHFENLEYKEAADGTGQLYADVCVLPSEDADWIRARMMHAVQYAKKYPDKEFVALSINAGGDARRMPVQQFLREHDLVPSAKLKIQQAIDQGLEEIKVVKVIDHAVSCDLVTEAGAKGKVLNLLEGAKTMAVENKKEDEQQVEKKEGEQKDAPAPKDKEAPGAGAHDDEAKDKELILAQLRKHGLVGENEENAEMMQAAHGMHKAYKENGHSSEEAATRAVESMKCSKKVQEAAAAKDDAAKKEAEKAKAKESAAPAVESEELKALRAEKLRLEGENARLRESNTANEVEKHLDKALAGSGLPRAATKKFREANKGFKNTKEVDEKLALFVEGYKAVGGEADSAGSLEEFVMTEKNAPANDSKGSVDLSDCVQE
jgi:hypothetical protein